MKRKIAYTFITSALVMSAFLIGKTAHQPSIPVDDVAAYYVDSNGNIINTLVENCNCIQAQFDYQIHKRNLEKYQYDISERKGWNFEYFQDTKSQDDDTLQQALLDCASGVPLHILVQRYGRDFIIHYRTIKCLVADIILEEKGVNPFTNNNTNIDEKF